MQGNMNVKFVNAKHAKEIYQYRNTREKLQNKPAIWYKNLQETYHCRMYSRKLLMMGREDARNMYSFITE
jgi:hypothetical protein